MSEAINNTNTEEKDLQTMEAAKRRFYANCIALAEVVWLEYVPTLRNEEYIHYFDFIMKKRLLAKLREMKIRISTPIGSLRNMEYLFFAFISLLFGLCSSQSSFIFHAFYSSSLSRIPAL